MVDKLFFFIAKFYAFLYFYTKKFSGIRISGLGFILRLIRKPQIINYKNKKLYISPKVISSYGISIINKSQEKETEDFLDKIMDGLKGYKKKVNFIDVGSNIGIFLLKMSSYRNINFLIGFEPSIEAVEAASKTLELNNFNKFKIFNNLVGSNNKKTYYSNDIDPQRASVYSAKKSKKKILLKEIRLDDNKAIKKLSIDDYSVMLIDVEGYEPNVINGGLNFIKNNKPLIIFEYNYLSKKYYSINQIYSLLGEGWEILRLRNDSLLDYDVENTWNCIAIHKKSVYSKLFKNLGLYFI
tara:strand:- start:3588 stop:4478 length:891 start_codon:yes stop_codon:yes gene_type:complete